MPAQPQKHTDYSGTPLPKKLGIVSSSVKPAPTEVCLLAAPADFQRSLGELPSHVTFTQRLTPRTTLALCFIRSLPDLDATIDILIAKLPKTASAWIIRPKTHLKPGFNENHVRDAALAHGLVDYKICAVDDNWSGIKFAWRKACGAKGAAQHATAACRPGCIARLQRSDDASCSLPARKAAGTKE